MLIERYRHAQLLVVLTALLLANPFLRGTFVFAVVDLALLLVLVSAIFACAERPREAVAGVVLGLLVLGSAWYRSLSGIETVTTLYSALALLFFAVVTAMVLADVFRAQHAVSLDTICAAVAAYLLMGVGWAFAYALLESLVPGSFEGMRDETGYDNDYQRYLGFSFVTMTTLGYGNVVPANAKSEALAAGEAVVGQVYLTVLVARLVALNLMWQREGPRADDDSEPT